MTRVHHTGKPGIIRRCWREAARPLRAPAAESGVGSLVLRLPVQAEDGIRRVGGVCPGTFPTCSRRVLWIGVGGRFARGSGTIFHVSNKSNFSFPFCIKLARTAPRILMRTWWRHVKRRLCLHQRDGCLGPAPRTPPLLPPSRP